MSREFEPLAPACMKCEQVTGQSTCFPGPCRFYHERNAEGTKAHSIAVIDRVRRGMRETVHASTQTPLYQVPRLEGWGGEQRHANHDREV